MDENKENEMKDAQEPGNKIFLFQYAYVSIIGA